MNSFRFQSGSSYKVSDLMNLLKTPKLQTSVNPGMKNPFPVENRRFHRSRSKVRAKGLRYQPEEEVKKKPLPPQIEKALIIALVGSIIISSGMLAYAKMTREKESFTMLYLLGPDGKAEGYPTESLLYVPINVTVGIENHELRDVVYVLQMKVDGKVIRELNVTLSNGETWQNNLTYTRQELKNGKSKLEFALFKQKPENFPYRSVHLYIENTNSFTNLTDENIRNVPNLKTFDTAPPKSSVLELPAFTNSASFNVFWNGTDDVSGIAYYSIDSSTDGVNWEPWISRTTNTSSVFVGANNQTYYFRSKAVDYADNKEPAHAESDTKIKVYTETPVVTLNISPNPCIDYTNITVTSPMPLTSVVCRVTPDGFRPQTGELTSTDGLTWTSDYTVRYGKHFSVEAICTDIYGNRIPVYGEIFVDNSMSNVSKV